MPFLLLLLLLLVPALLVFSALMVPIGIRRRYRAGSRRQPVNRAAVAFALFGFSTSTAVLAASSLVTAIWDPRAILGSAAGFGTGLLTGALGMALANWETATDSRDRLRLYVTPKKWLVFLVYVVVAARVLYSLARAIMLIGRTGEESLLVEAGVAGSLAAAAFFLAYNLCFTAGVGWKLRRWAYAQRRAA